MFTLEKAKLYRAILLSRNPIFGSAKIFRKVFFLLFILSFLLFLYGFLMDGFTSNFNAKLLGIMSLSLYLFITFSLIKMFFYERIRNSKSGSWHLVDITKENFNLADIFDFKSLKLFYEIKTKFKKINAKKYPSFSLLFAILSIKSKKIDFIAARILLDKKIATKSLIESLEENKGVEDVSLEKICLDAAKRAKKLKKEQADILDLFWAACKNNTYFKRFLNRNNITLDDIKNVLMWVEKIRSIENKRKFWWKKENLLLRGSIGREWSFGYTPTLDRFSFDWTRSKYAVHEEEVFGHEKEVKELESVLSKKGINNALLIGLVGSGRKSVIRKLAARSFVGESAEELNFARFVELDLKRMLSVVETMSEFEKFLSKIFDEVVEAGNVILIVQDIQNFISKKRAVGRTDVSAILTPYLKSEMFRIVATTDPASYYKDIEDNKTFDSLFEKIQIKEISSQEALQIIEIRALLKEYEYKRFITFKALSEIVNLCEKYIPNIPFPEKSIRVLEEVFNHAKNRRVKIITKDVVYEVFSEKLGIPVGKIEEREKEKLLNLEDLIHERIIDQQEAVGEISSALRRARSEITIRKGPLGAFLFLGPTGVGKTETAKALADIYFGSEKNIIRIDMSEFQNTGDIERLIGGDNYPEGILSQMVKEKPFSLLLLDEIEKANQNILNLFLQVLDEGHLMDASGQRISFRHTIIIATSNAGYELIIDSIKRSKDMESIKEELVDFLIKNHLFRPEFLNRFDAVVVFKSLSQSDLLSISKLMLRKLKENLKVKGIDFNITEDVVKKVAELGYNPMFGAREMRRVIQNKLEDEIAKSLLKGVLKPGDKFRMVAEKDGFYVEKL